MDPKKRVLSIQSHVVSGYVGNKAAVFPLQLLGFDVDVVNSVHFSNHTGFQNGWEGDVLQGDQLRSIMKGLERNGLLNDIGHILTGYIGSESFLEAVMDVLRTIRTLQQQQQQEEIKQQQNNSGSDGQKQQQQQQQQKRKRKKLRYVCDPVLGDVGSGFYVPQELVRLFRERVIPEADVITPNQFEAEQLTGMTMGSIDDVREVCNKFHDMGPKLVLITSVLLNDNNDDKANEGKSISIIVSSRSDDDRDDKDKDGGTATTRTRTATKMWRIDCPELPGRYTGTGDLLSALLLGHSAINPDNLPETLEKVMNTMYACIKKSLDLSPEISLESNFPRGLMLIQCKDIIENPPQVFKARLVE